MRSILLHIGSDEGMENRLQVALDLARKYDGHVSCLHVANLQLVLPSGYSEVASAVAMSHIKEAADDLREQMEKRLTKEDIAWDWVFLQGVPEDRLIQRAVVYDIVIVGETEDTIGGIGASRLAGILATRSRTPVLVVPNRQTGIDVDAPAVVAWNGAAEAGNALRAALPILRCASQVHLVQVDEGRETTFDLPATYGAQYLARHGIKAEMVTLPAGKKKTGDVLVAAAMARDASCLVMGAYGRSRFQEAIFGGVTRQVLTEPQLPVFLTH